MLQVNTNGHSPTVVTLLLDSRTAWLNDLSTQLVNQHYDVLLARSPDDTWSLLSTQQPDALVASGDCQDSLALYDAICDRIESDYRPLLVLVQDMPLPATLPPDGVLLLPSSFVYFEHQLRTFLALRAANHRLYSANLALLEENRQLRDDVAAQTSRSDEINLLKNAIVRNVSHELRTPLLQIKSAVSLLAEDVGRDNRLIDYATGATARLEAAVRNITLLNELLNESMDAHTPGPVQVGEVIQQALRNLRRSWEHKDQIERIQTQLEANLPPVQADKQGLAIVLQLLLDNALKFSEQTVEIKASRADNWLTIAITDHGIGIPVDKLDRIFESFYQIDSSTTRRYSGMGIGLAIVRFILDRHHCRISVTSVENQGSTFTFSLPVVELC